MESGEAIQWRRDGQTSLPVRLLWAGGLGTFIAAAGLIVLARLYTILDLSAEPIVLVGAGAGIAVGVAIVAAIASVPSARARLANRLPYVGDEGGLVRLVDTAVAAVLVGAVMLVLVWYVGGGPGQGLAAGLLPLAFLALVLAAMLRTTGTLDVETGRLYLHDADVAVDLADVAAVSRHELGPVVICRLRYHEPDGTYVPGPRWLWLPPGPARALSAAVP